MHGNGGVYFNFSFVWNISTHEQGDCSVDVVVVTVEVNTFIALSSVLSLVILANTVNLFNFMIICFVAGNN